MNQCSKCGQELPLDQEVFQNFDRMCKIWISLLMQPTKELISIEQFDRLFNPKMEKKMVVCRRCSNSGMCYPCMFHDGEDDMCNYCDGTGHYECPLVGEDWHQ